MNEEAKQRLETLLTISKETRDKKGQVGAYNNLGMCYQSLGQYDKAIKYLETNLMISKEIGHKEGEGTAYNNLGRCYQSLGQYDKAIKYLEMNLKIAKETGRSAGEGATYNNLGTCYKSLGQYDKAIKYLEMNLKIAKETGHKAGEGATYNNLGTCYKSLGQYDKAIKYLEMNLKIAKEIGHKAGEGAAYNNLGRCYISLGQCDKAIKYLEMNLKIAKEIGHKAGEGTAYNNLGRCHQYLGQCDKAIKYLEMNLKIAKETGHKAGEGATYNNLGTCYISLRQYDKAIKYLEMNLKIAKEIGHKAGEGAAYNNLGRCYQFLGQYDKAINYLEMNLKIAKEIGHKEGEGAAYNNLGRCYQSLGQYDKAENLLKKKIEVCEELFKNVPKWDEDKVSIIDTFILRYKALMFIYLLQGNRGEALITAEKGRARALKDLMLSTDLVRRAGVNESRDLDLYKIRKMVKALGSTVLYFTIHINDVYMWVIQPNGDVTFLSNSLSSLELDLKSPITSIVELMTSCGEIRCEDRSLSFLYHEEVPKRTKKTLESVLARDSLPLSFTDTQSAAIQPRIPQLAPVQIPRITRNNTAGQTETAVPTDHEQLDKKSLMNVLLKSLYSTLLYPVRQYLAGSQVVIVPDGALALVPFAALVDENGHYVPESLRVRLVPSLTTAEMIRKRPEEPAGGALVVGDPNVGKLEKGDEIVDVPRLESAREEVKMVGRLLGVTPLMGRKATKETFLQKVENASVIHIAAHGDAESGEILLAPPPGTNKRNPVSKEDVMLMISDLEGKRLKAKLVVLSCCYSGCGKVRGEGVIGIARAFLGAGARAVLVTLWAVNDLATLAFMCGFYQSLSQGRSANEALNEGMKTVREPHETFRHPRYWAPFVLLGEDVTLPSAMIFNNNHSSA